MSYSTNLQACRTCLTFHNQSSFIHLDDDSISNLKECLLTEIHMDENLPQYICAACWQTVNVMVKFRRKYQETLEILQQYLATGCDVDWLKSRASENSDSVIVKEEVDYDSYVKVENEWNSDVNMHAANELNLETRHSANDESHTSSDASDDIRQYKKKRKKTSKKVAKIPRESKARKPRRALPVSKRAKKSQVTRNSLSCKKCGKIFNQEKRLIKHEIAHKYDLDGFQCPKPECGRTMRRLKDLYAHMKNTHGGGRDFRCELCNAGFFLLSQLEKHKISIHNITNDNKSESCSDLDDEFMSGMDGIEGIDIPFKSELKLDEDIDAFLNDKLKRENDENEIPDKTSERKRSAKSQKKSIEQHGNFPCPACPFVLSCHRSLQRHILQHLEPRFPCPATSCPRKFHESFRLNAHVRLKHKSLKLVNKCEHCPEKFYSGELLEKHTKDRHSEIHEALCDTCGMYYKNIKEHLKTHKRETEVKKCKYCDKDYSSRQLLLKHIRANHEKKICHICGKTYVFKTHLIKHELGGPTKSPKKEQDKNGSYPCKVCNKVFKVKHNMQTHESVVHRSKMVTCKLCDLTMKRKSLQRHMIFKHTDKAAFSCEYCNQPCKTKESLQNHLRTHTDERPYACTYCEKRFRQSKTCLYHMRLHTGERPHVCKICDKRFAQPYALTVHVKTHAKFGKNAIGNNSSASVVKFE